MDDYNTEDDFVPQGLRIRERRRPQHWSNNGRNNFSHRHHGRSFEARPSASGDRLQFFRPGLQIGQLRKLKQKYFMPQRKIDITNVDLSEIDQVLEKFLKGCLSHGIRYAMLSHGEACDQYKDPYPLLKNKINVWLRDYNEVLAFVSAKEEHGGTGSTYLILKKKSEGVNFDEY